MEYFLVRYDSRVVIYDRRGFIRLATGLGFLSYKGIKVSSLKCFAQPVFLIPIKYITSNRMYLEFYHNILYKVI